MPTKPSDTTYTGHFVESMTTFAVALILFVVFVWAGPCGGLVNQLNRVDAKPCVETHR